MSKEQKDGYTVEQAFEDMQSGINLGIKDLTAKLNSSITELSKAEMKRALQSMINFPDAIKVYGKREELFIKDLVALHGLHLQAEIQVLAELQQQGDENGGQETEDSTIG